MKKIILVSFVLLLVIAFVFAADRPKDARLFDDTHCGQSNVHCTFDSGDAWAGLLNVNGPVFADNLTTSMLVVDTGDGQYPHDLYIRDWGAGSRIYMEPEIVRISPSEGLYLQNLPMNGSGTTYYLCIDGVNNVYKSLEPCV